jgi:hypothetical protein
MYSKTADFLATVIFCSNDETVRESTLYDFEPRIVAAVDLFFNGFNKHLEQINYDFDKLDCLTRSLGGGVYLSLSGHGAGLWDESSTEAKELHEILVAYAGKHRFENLEGYICADEEQHLVLSIKEEYYDEVLNNFFKV